MKEYSLIVTVTHMGELLEALRDHQVATENAPGHEQEKAVVADLCRRAELLSQVVQAGANLAEAQAAYDYYCEHGTGDAPTAGTVKVMERPI